MLINQQKLIIMNTKSPLAPETIPLEEAKVWTKNWQVKNPTHAKAFLIPVDDLIACFNEMGAKYKTDENGRLHVVIDDYEPYIRAYMSIDDSSEEHLLIVGTTTEDGIQYDDMIGSNLNNPVDDNSIEGSGVYDFTKPCPNNCDENSPLYHKPKVIFSK
ncbi:hypothetical protein A9Q86_14670 [Flavobacteriales bacterium 33_180_T64]|nr:hypothetical protein A9Q86_14670 [Flavobacteriales bacterium 33_180_T64]